MNQLTGQTVYHHQDLTKRIIAAAISVHRELGAGLLESAYQACLAREFELAGLPFEREKPLPVEYKGVALDCGYRLDFVVDAKVVVELKVVESLEEIHKAQMLTYLKLTGCKVGLLINFNVPVLRDGIKRMVL
ncbi:MAG: GxxExxY protein [Armatimonadetes bacterium]|nr:GxxExxY protein [Armatimonadota bacterium]